MSTLVAVRIPDDLLTKLDAKGKRSRVILAALAAYLDSPVDRITIHPPVVIKVDAPTKTIHVSPKRIDTPAAAIRAVAPLGRVGQKCPHGWMNAYVCPECTKA